MADLNLCLFTGRLGKDPELKYFQSGDAYCNVSLAVGKKWKDKNSGETKEQTTWVPCVFTGKSAELLAQYAKKGSQLRVNGEFSVRKYQQDGADRYTTEIRASDFQLLGGRPDGAAPAPAPAARPPAATAAAPKAAALDADIPF